MYEAAWMGYYQQRRRTWLHSEPTATDSNSGFPFHLICRIETVWLAFLWPRKHDCYQPHVPPFRSHITALNGSPRESLDSQRLSASPRQPLPGKVLQAVSVQNRPSPADVTLTHTHTQIHTTICVSWLWRPCLSAPALHHQHDSADVQTST